MQRPLQAQYNNIQNVNRDYHVNVILVTIYLYLSIVVLE